jgi:energy-coupling factor transporter ATP-binding protein EcfA2
MAKSMTPELRAWRVGARWHRWEPHIHAPGTKLNDQFGGADPWDSYLENLEAATPPMRAIGVTDYYSLDCYERLLTAKVAGRLPNCNLLFPNIEMRLGIGTVRNAFVNVHLLVSPDDPDHIVQIKRFLGRLTLRAHEDKFACTPEDLTRLGYAADPAITDPGAALAHGSTQFKVSLDQLQEAYRDMGWAQDNILIAVAGGSNDGTSGVNEAADATLRREIERFAHIIFSGTPAQREFWLGRRAMSPTEIIDRYGALKPCLHGCDAHDHRTTGQPALDRFSWIKGQPHFDALRQACIEPAGRAWIGAVPPSEASFSQVMHSIELRNAPWALTPKIVLNPGLVAIIGARGSGKTALADAIAQACDATGDQLDRQSFLTRAREHLTGSTVRLRWGDLTETDRPLDGSWSSDVSDYPKARYLSQQFVDTLCSADGMTDALLGEVERVVFEAHAPEARDGAVDFQDMLDTRSSRHRQAREREEEALVELSDRIGTELEKTKAVAGVRKLVDDKRQTIARYAADRGRLVSKGSEVRAARLGLVASAAEKVSGYLRWFANRETALLTLRDDVADLRTNRAPATLSATKERHRPSGIADDDWNTFLLNYQGDVDTLLTKQLETVKASAQSWRGTPPPPLADPQQPLIADDVELDKQSLALLNAEVARLTKLVSLDADTQKRFTALTQRIAAEGAELQKLVDRLTDYEGAKERVPQLLIDRQAGYARIFGSILAEEAVLRDLYAPIRARLDASGGTLAKLSFSIRRVVDIERWAEAGESLLDLRHYGPFQGKGALQARAERTLAPAWRSGDAAAVTAAMGEFRQQNQDELMELSRIPKGTHADYRAWLKKFAQWLYSTDHIAVRYSVDYDGTDIRSLSPGTRGIVLLLLYLALDDADDRPLIIDQPEENLDPKSIYDELVGLFLAAKTKRQVIMVTHNANLVINTDADQIIIAGAGPRADGGLPGISYLSGGLEDADIREAVCDILEGGEHAFRERARRLRVNLRR